MVMLPLLFTHTVIKTQCVDMFGCCAFIVFCNPVVYAGVFFDAIEFLVCVGKSLAPDLDFQIKSFDCCTRSGACVILVSVLIHIFGDGACDGRWILRISVFVLEIDDGLLRMISLHGDSQ